VISHNLHIDEKTYRRIEKDKAIPRIDLLENMSLIFKEDLVLSFVKYNSHGMEMLEKIKEDIDIKIIESDFDKLNEDIPRLKTLINTIKNPCYIQQYEQYIFLIEGTVVYNEGINYDKSIEISTEGILIGNENFSIDQYNNFIYSNLELRLLMNIAFSFNRLGDQEKYFEIFDFIGGKSALVRMLALRLCNNLFTSSTGPSGSLAKTSFIHVCNQLVSCNPSRSV